MQSRAPSQASEIDADRGGPLIFISAAEPSADLHGASLIRSFRRLCPSVRFAGGAGPRMVEAGCEPLYDMTSHAAMLTGAFRIVPKALAAIRQARRFLQSQPVDLAIVIDSPTMHLPLAKHIRSSGTPLLYFIAPQMWAWGEHRVKRLRARANRLAVILPFEEEYFRNHGIQADYVGNPLFDSLATRQIDQQESQRIRTLGEPVVCIFPGSRTHVVKEVMPGQIEVASAIAERFANAHFCIGVASERVRGMVAELAAKSGLRHSLHERQNGEIITAADLALAASGTITLETAYYHLPMIVMYNASRIWYHALGRWLITTKRYCLVNILAGRDLVPEFMPFYRSTAPIRDKALELLESREKLDAMRRELASTIDPLVKTGAADNTAEIALSMIARSPVRSEPRP